MRGPHSGEFMGVAPTGKQCAMGWIAIQRIAGDQVCEAWLEMDLAGLLQQIGAIPVPAGAAS